MTRARIFGFTLIELMIALAIAALLAILAMPGYSLWIADGQIRNAAESIAGGMRYAQAEAIKESSQVEFVLDPTTGTGGWIARLVAAPAPPLQVGSFREGADRTTLTPLPAGTTTVTFTGFGTIAPANADASAPLTRIQVTSSTGAAGARNLEVLVGNSRTGIKICDPKWPAADPKGCPP
jgi:prepilin-type N-terminal cleavage/methylation domain-containing protein